MSADASALGALERVLMLKAVPELSDLHPDDLASVAERTIGHRLEAGAPLPAGEDGACCVHFLLEGSVREPCGERDSVQREAPAMLGALCALAGGATAPGVAEREASTLALGRSALIDVLRDDFEVWFALLRHVCRLALEAHAGPSLAAEERPEGVPVPAPSPGQDLAERIALLRRVPALGELRVHLLGQIAAEMELVSFERDEVLCEPGSPADSVLVIVEGSVGVPSDARAPGAGPGSLLGFAEAFAGQPRRHALTAREPLRALRLDAETLIDILEDHPDAAVDLLCALASEVLRLPRDEAGPHAQA